MVTKQNTREALEYIQSYIEECDHWDNKEPLLGDIAKFLAEQPSSEFRTPDCPDCACVQDGQCLCTPSKPPAGMELTNEEIARHLGYSDVSDILNGHTILPKDIIDDVRKVISADRSKTSVNYIGQVKAGGEIIAEHQPVNMWRGDSIIAVIDLDSEGIREFLTDHFAKQTTASIEPKDQHPMQPVMLVKGIARFKANPIVEHLLDNGGIDMNALARKGFSREDREHFAQLIGYSVGGFSTLSYASDRICDKAIKAANSLMAKQGGAA